MSAIDIRVTGDKELQRALDALPDKLQKKFVRHALRKAGKMVMADAKNRVPVWSGALQQTLVLKGLKPKKFRIGVKVETPTREELSKYQPTAGKAERVYNEKGYYPMAVEYGTRKMAAHPYLRPALDGNSSAVINAFATDLREEIDGAKA